MFHIRTLLPLFNSHIFPFNYNVLLYSKYIPFQINNSKIIMKLYYKIIFGTEEGEYDSVVGSDFSSQESYNV